MPLVRRPSLYVVHLPQNSTDSDDGSVSSWHSTITVDSPTKKQKSNDSPIAASSSRLPKVHFDESTNIYHRNTVWTREECRDRWYSAAEMQTSKARMVQMAREVYQSEKTNTAPHSFQRTVLSAYDACCRASQKGEMDTDGSTTVTLLTTDEATHLTRWMHVAVSRLGLERVCIREIAKDRSHRRRHVVDAVLDAQDSLVATGQWWTSPDAADDVLRQASQGISRPSRYFAAVTARAQMDAAAQC